MSRFIRDSKIAKAVAGLVGISMALSLVLGAVAPASAQTVDELTAQINSLLQTIAQLQAQLTKVQGGNTTPATGTVGSYNFAKDLQIGSRGDDVKNLQIFIGVTPATGYFGALTKAAVIKFQKDNGIKATGYVGPMTRGKLNSMTFGTDNGNGNGGINNGNGNTVPVTGTVSVSLAPTSPQYTAVVAGASIADLAEYVFTNGTNAPLTVTNVTLNRTGISNDNTLTNVYLYKGVTRLTDSATVSNGKITFNAPSGLFTVPANSMMTVAVRADVASNSSGQTIGVSLASVSAANVTVAGSFPIAAYPQSVASATLGTLDFTGPVTPSAATVDPQSDYVMWQNSINVGSHDLFMKALALRQIGSVANGDLGNFRLYVDGNQVGSAVASLDVNGYVTFDLSANPVKLTTGSHVLKMVGDVVGGSTRTFSFSLRQASDINVVDSQLSSNILPTVANATFSAITTGDQTVNSGALTITKDTTSPSGNVTLLASGATLAKFQIKASGEPIKIESLTVTATTSDVNVGSIRNGALFANGSQIGSTADITTSAAGTQYNLGSALVVTPGSVVTLEVRGDIYDNSGSQDLSNNDTITVSLKAGTNNAQKTKSLTYFGTSAASGNQLTVAQGNLSLSKYAAYANQAVVVPQTAYKIGEYTLTTGSTEDVNLNTLTVGLTYGGVLSNITDLYVVYGSQQTSNKSTVAASNVYSINSVIRAGQTMDIAVYATLGNNATGTVATTLTVGGQTALSNQTLNSSTATGQTITIGTGSLSAAQDASTPVAQNVVGGAQVKVGSFKFSALSDSFTVTDIGVSVTAAAAGSVQSVTLKTGSTVLKDSQAFDASVANPTATSTGLTFSIPANTTKVLDVYLNLSPVGTPGFATSSADVKVTLAGYKFTSSTGVQTTMAGTATTSNDMYVFKSLPTVTRLALPTSGAGSLQNGTMTMAKFQVASDAAGPISWDKVVFNVTKDATSRIDDSTFKVYDDANNQVLGTISTSTASLNSAATAGTVTFTPSTEQQVSGSRWYVLKATVSGAAANGYITTVIPATGSQAASKAAANVTGSFVWSDQSASPHDTTTADWNNDYMIKTLPTDAWSLQY